MSRHRDKIQAAEDILFQNIATLLKKNEYFSIGGFATLMNWKRSRRCFISMTNERLILLWLRKKYREVEEDKAFNIWILALTHIKIVRFFQ